MSVKIIDTLKPKNNGSFPIVEAVDVSVSESLRLPEALNQKADQSDLVALEAVVEEKADASDVTTATANLQAQIDSLINPVTEDAEVENARVGADGTSYQTLKARIDTEITEANSKLKLAENKEVEVSDINHKILKNNLAYQSKRSDGTVIVGPSSGIGDVTFVEASATGRFRLKGTLRGSKSIQVTLQSIALTSGKTYTYYVATSNGLSGIYVAVGGVQSGGKNVQTNIKAKAMNFVPDSTVTNATITFYNATSSEVDITGDYYIYLAEGAFSDKDFEMDASILNAIEDTRSALKQAENETVETSNVDHTILSENFAYLNRLADGTVIVGPSSGIGDVQLIETSANGRISLDGTILGERTVEITDAFTLEAGHKYTYYVRTNNGLQSIFVSVRNVQSGGSNIQTNVKNRPFTFTTDETVSDAKIAFYNPTDSEVDITGDYYIYIVEGEYAENDFDISQKIDDNTNNIKEVTRSLVVLSGDKYEGTASAGHTTGYKYPIKSGHTYKFINNATDISTMNVYVSKTSAFDATHQVLSSVGRQYIRYFTADDDYEYLHVYSTTGDTFSIVDLNGLYSTLGEIPEYYKEHIEEKITEINNISSECGLHGDAFVFMTDYHRQGNAENSNKLIEKILNNTHARFFLFGGDTQDTADSIEGGIEQIRLFIAKFSNVSDRMISLLGNHEFNPYTMDDTADQYMLDYNQAYRLLLKRRESEYGDISEYGNFWFDNKVQKIRYICTTTDGFAKMEEESVKWVLNAMKETPDGYTIIVFSHLTYDISPEDNTKVYLRNGIFYVAQAMDAYNERTTYTYDGDTFDFSNCNAYAMCVIGGHTHFDMDSSQEDKFLIPEYLPQVMPDTQVIATTTDSYMRRNKNVNPLERIVSTITEQAFDFVNVDTLNNVVDMIRIGAGYNRTFHLNTVTTATTLISKLSGTVSWSSSDTSVATVTSGTITKVANGRTRIVATDDSNNIEVWTVKLSD